MIDTPRAGLKTLNHRSDWTTARLKFLFKREARPVLETDEVVTAFRDGIVTLRKNRREDGFTFAELEIGYQGIEPNDLVIHAMDGFAGAIGVSDSRGKGSPVLTIATPIANAEPRFWAYYLRNLAVTGFIQSLAKGIRERSTDFRWKDASNLLVNFPDLATQRAIADFLDRETARIDLLIEKKQRLVSLLGDHWDRFTFDLFSLDTPTRFELDKSGWQHQKLKFLSPQVTVGIVVTPAAYYTDDGVPAIRGTNIRAMDLRLDDMVSITDEGHRINKKSAIAEGDVVVVRTGQPGTAAVVPKALDGANCIDVILIKKSKKYDSYLLAHFLNSSAAKAQYSSGSSGAIQQHFNISIASNLVVPVPPSSEQDRVLAILRQEGQRVRNLTSTLQTSIERLKEYRSALITAAVTGQIDVSTFSKSGATDRRLDTIQEEMGA